MPRHILAAAGLALAGGLGVLAVNAAEPANAQAGFRVTVEQLKINQRISQAAVRRANENRARLDTLGSRTSALETKVNQPAPGPAMVVTYSVSTDRPWRPGEPMASPPILPPGETTAGPEPVGIERVEWPEEGTAWVVLKGDPRKCIANATPTEGPSVIRALNGREPGAPENTVQVNTWTLDGTPRSHRFNLVVFCPPR